MLSLPLRAPFPHEVTGIFTTAMPMLAHRDLKGTLGNWRSRLSVTATQMRLAEHLRCGAWHSLGRGRLHSACVKGGIRTRFTRDAKYPKSSPPASVEPRRKRLEVVGECAANRIVSVRRF
jgi:hypothetical protein